jgi:hypothetical protein
MDKIYYIEKQQYGNGFYVLVAIPIVAAFMIWVMNQPQTIDATQDAADLSYLELVWIDAVLLVMSLGLFLLFRFMSLNIKISGDQLEFTYSPFLRTPIVYKRYDIKEWEVRSFSPMTEFGGLGYRKRKGLRTKDLSYTMKGNKGLQLTLANGEKVLIGTQYGTRLESAMRKWKGGK